MALMTPHLDSPPLVERLRSRRQTLGMTYAALAERSRVPTVTVERMLSRRAYKASLEDVAAIAAALGLGLDLKEEADPVDMVRQQAEAKARQLVDLVQGTSLLEAQGVDEAHRRRMVQDTTLKLLNRPRRQLWDRV